MNLDPGATVLVVGLGAAGRRYAGLVRRLYPAVRIVALRRPGQPPGVLVDETVHDLSSALATSPQFAVVSGPASQRVALATELARSGIHLLLEKPLGVELEALEALKGAVQASDVTVAVGYNLRFLPALQHVKSLMDDEVVGGLQLVRAEVGQHLAQWRPGEDYRASVSAQRELGGGALLELSHEIDLVRWLAGDVVSVGAELASVSDLAVDVEDVAELILRFDTGAIGSVHLDMVQRPPRRNLRLVGDQGMIRCDLLTGMVSRTTPDGAETRDDFESDVGTTYEKLLLDFVASVGSRRRPEVDLAAGVRTLEIVVAARRASQSGSRQRINQGAAAGSPPASTRCVEQDPVDSFRPRDRVAVICARGGSKGVPGKNLLEIEGRTLLGHAIAHARASGLFGSIVVSSDDAAVLEEAARSGVEFLIRRPRHLATDDAPKLGVIRHAVDEVESQVGYRFETIVDLDVTTPLRRPADVVAVVHELESSSAGNVLTASPANRSPYFNQVQLDDAGVRLPCGDGAITDRQSGPRVFDLTGAVYAWRRAVLFMDGPLVRSDTRIHVIPRERGWDIDDPVDLTIVRALAADATGTS